MSNSSKASLPFSGLSREIEKLLFAVSKFCTLYQGNPIARDEIPAFAVDTAQPIAIAIVHDEFVRPLLKAERFSVLLVGQQVIEGEERGQGGLAGGRHL